MMYINYLFLKYYIHDENTIGERIALRASNGVQIIRASHDGLKMQNKITFF
jgi:hypothetical protein